MVRIIMNLVTILTFVASLLGCGKTEVLDGDGSVYHDEDYRTEYANVYDFAFGDKDTLFAVAFLGYGEDAMVSRNNYVNGVFEGLSDDAVKKVEHFSFEGDEWYLVVPRYKDAVEITNLGTGEKYVVYKGEAFTVKCNLSDLYSNIKISTADGKGTFSPQMSGEGKLVTNAFVHDITDYSVTTDYYMDGE